MRDKKILNKIKFSKDLRKLTIRELPLLSKELREYLIESVAESGGHFGSNLGVVELTIALHYVFNTPEDLLVWDVGHQTYPHKILTGRKDKIKKIRQRGGLAPFPKRSESKFDTFDVGHSATSISAGLGMVVAEEHKRTKKRKKEVVVVIGDGALGGGMALEALNHAGDIKANILIILNDNKMSISKNVGGLCRHLTKLRSSWCYNKIKSKSKKIFKYSPALLRAARQTKTKLKGVLATESIFEKFGFKYYGPTDGHDLIELVKILKYLKRIKGPKVLHVVTTKGKGYKPAEKDEFCLHATKPFDIKNKTTEKKKKNTSGKTYTDIFSDWIVEKGKKSKKLQAITPAMCSGSGLNLFAKLFPERFHDVGIAEQHAVTFAGGLASRGMKPVVAIYSTFLQRAYDQVIHDIALPNLDVLFAIDRAGIVGPDGATHAGSFDLSFLRVIPNLTIMVPATKNECYAMLEAGYQHPGPVAVRYPRSGSNDRYTKKGRTQRIKIGRAKIVYNGNQKKNKKQQKKIAILAFGAMVEKCRLASKKLSVTLVNMRFVKPLDGKLLKKLAKTHSLFVTVEDNVIAGGAGSAINEFVLDNNLKVRVKNVGLPDKFLPHGTREEILSLAGLDEEGILEKIKKIL